MKKKFLSTSLSAAASALALISLCTPVSAESPVNLNTSIHAGQDDTGTWIPAGTDDNGVYHDGYWIDTSWQSETTAGWQEYKNNSVISYDGMGNWTGTQIMNVPIYSQFDPRWRYVVVGGHTINDTGCSPTCGAMIFSHFGIPGTPADWGRAFHEADHYNTDRFLGTESATWGDFAQRYGLVAWYVTDYNSLYTALKNGMIVKCSIRVSPSATHGIVLGGLTPNGMTTVYEPHGFTYENNIVNILNNASDDKDDWSGGSPFVALGWEY